MIPDVYVDFTLDLNDPEFVNLNAIGGLTLSIASTNNWGLSAAGFNSNGIIIYRGPMTFMHMTAPVLMIMQLIV